MVKNSLKFTVKGQITILASYNNSSRNLIVHVVDTGAGIAHEDLDKLFSKFGKLHRTANMNHEGIGLGLTIVKQIVEKSGGKVNVHSEGIGKGSTFVFNMCMKSLDHLKAEQVPPRLLVVNESVEALDMEFTPNHKKNKSMKHPGGFEIYDDSEQKDAIFSTKQGISNPRESANVSVSLTDSVPKAFLSKNIQN